MTWQFWGAIIVALISSGVSPAVVPKILAWKNRKEREEKERREREHQDDLERNDRERDTWFRESAKAYARVEQECKRCQTKLERYSEAFNIALEDLEDQVIPMLILPQADPEQLRGVVRAIVRKARVSVRDTLDMPSIPEGVNNG